MSDTTGRALVTGATGTIGRRFVEAWGEDRTVVVGRDGGRLAQTFPRAAHVAWDGYSPLDARALEGVDVVLHLAGEPVAEGRWTPEKKARIEESRVAGTRALIESLRAAPRRPRVLVSASAVGYYGTRGDEILEEASSAGHGFLAEVCKAWEREAERAVELGVRVVRVRIGIVLARDGGALQKMLPPFRAGVGGPLGDGKQWVPWIHADDVVGLLAFAAERDDVAGPLNAAAPTPVTNAELSRTIGRVLRRPALVRAPALVLRLALGEMAEAVLGSQRVVPARALAAGYAFRFPHLEGALEDLLGEGTPRARAAS